MNADWILLRFDRTIHYESKENLENLLSTLFYEKKEWFNYWLHYLGFFDIYNDEYCWRNIFEVSLILEPHLFRKSKSQVKSRSYLIFSFVFSKSQSHESTLADFFWKKVKSNDFRNKSDLSDLKIIKLIKLEKAKSGLKLN